MRTIAFPGILRTACLSLLWPALLYADPVAVRVPEIPARVPLVLRTVGGKTVANGVQTQTIGDATVTSHVVFRFPDGSRHDETTVYSQSDVFRLLSYHLVQSGPSFRWALDMTLDTRTGRVVVRHRDRGGKEKVENRNIALPPDVANGMMVSVLKNLGPTGVPATASFVAAIPEPRLVQLAISRAGTEARVTHYVVRAVIGGLSGVLAPLVGKQPPDTHVWIADGPPPSFVRSEGPLFYGGPIWRIEVD